jgi:hypothetical protein
VAVPIETDYLLDVVPQEMGIYYHPTALQAQAIAARTYAYWYINGQYTIYNSANYQAFVPFKFQSLNIQFILDTAQICQDPALNTDQGVVCSATASRHYVSYNFDLPAFTEFTGDAYDHTISHSQQSTLYPYLLGVNDPISTACDANNYGHYRGMSQEGASRWTRGNQCSYAGAGDVPWNVSWERAEQILVHYYTGIHIRDANSGNVILTSAYRWNPLRINWGTPDNRPPLMFHGYSYPISVQVQNTGISDWNCGYPNFSYTLYYRWSKSGHPTETGSGSVSVCGQTKGDPSPLKDLTINNIPGWGPGAYRLSFDIYVSAYQGGFWFGEQWPPYSITICVDGPCYLYLPHAVKAPQ